MRCLLFILTFFMMSSALAQEVVLQPTWKDNNLQGKVKQVTSVQKYASGNDLTYEEQWEYQNTGELSVYTKRGFGGEKKTHYPLHQKENPLVQTSFDWDGDPLEERVFSAEGQLLTSKHFIYGNQGTLSNVIQYSYDPEKGGVVISRRLTQYDRKGHETLMELYDTDEVLLMRIAWKYDKRGNLTLRRQTSYEGQESKETTEKRSYTYDRQGNWTECSYTNNGNLIWTTTRTIIYF